MVAKLSLASKGVPKRSLGTRNYYFIIQPLLSRKEKIVS